ncbi:hypothetical protein SISSUDRAFT_336379 [Sistotremastrum suecicum HHB10207 ss-3]|uniref:Uncharacterized protein n=1 Tax=Sistotremastrum suecicum HHB10207 ss-3 TaxID=1314776 RepID=A0A166IVU2_9AGAM|nr:hypothetical protein SISSUDRAFT_336379 [Sistotremastrum suecicum HHB10207 ss-3]
MHHSPQNRIRSDREQEERLQVVNSGDRLSAASPTFHFATQRVVARSKAHLSEAKEVVQMPAPMNLQSKLDLRDWHVQLPPTGHRDVAEGWYTARDPKLFVWRAIQVHPSSTSQHNDVVGCKVADTESVIVPKKRGGSSLPRKETSHYILASWSIAPRLAPEPFSGCM